MSSLSSSPRRCYFASDASASSTSMDSGSTDLLVDPRIEYFEEYNKKRDHPNSVFQLKGLKFKEFTSERINFRFWPSKVVKHVVPDLSFYCVLFFDGKYWRLKRDSIPLDYKWKIYKLFWGEKFFCVKDAQVFGVIEKIQKYLLKWANNENKYRAKRRKLYEIGYLHDSELDEDDVRLILTNEQQEDRRKRIDAILQRMIPPKRKPEPKRLRRNR